MPFYVIRCHLDIPFFTERILLAYQPAYLWLSRSPRHRPQNSSNSVRSPYAETGYNKVGILGVHEKVVPAGRCSYSKMSYSGSIASNCSPHPK